MNSQDGNTRDESKMRRPELKDRLQAAWDRIDDLEGLLRRFLDAQMRLRAGGEDKWADHFEEMIKLRKEAQRALDGGGGDDE